MSTETAPAPAAQPKKSHPVLKIFLLLFVVVLVVGGGYFYHFLELKRNIKAYQDAMALVRSHQEIKTLLGEPIKEVFWRRPAGEGSEESGEANFLWNIYGPNGTGKVEMQAKKIGGNWGITTLFVTAGPDNKKFNLTSQVVGADDAPKFGEPATNSEKKEEKKEEEQGQTIEFNVGGAPEGK